MGQNCSQKSTAATSHDAGKSCRPKKEQSKPNSTTPDNGLEARVSLEEEEGMKKPHRYDDILKEADGMPKDPSEVIKDGIFLKNRRKKFWVEEKTGYNCFFLYARELGIIWSENENYWRWITTKENNDVEIEMAKLVDVCWLEIRGGFDASFLNPDVTYEVKFLVLMEPGYGWDVPVKLGLKLPEGSVQQHDEVLKEKQTSQWIELKAGELSANQEAAGTIEFSLFEIEAGNWKRGLVVKGVVIMPKYST